MAEWYGDATTDAVFNDVHYYFFKFEIFTAEICIMHKVLSWFVKMLLLFLES